MDNRRVIVKVPASTANLGPGFDSLGMALSLYAWIELGIAGQTVFELHGEGMSGLPQDKSNLVYKVAQFVFEEAGVQVPELSIRMYSEIPLTRGLGSSASAIVGALAAANALIGSPLSNDKLFQMATALEGHPDNVGASLFGGIVVSAWDGKEAQHVRIEPPKQLGTLVAIPNFHLSTEKARHALPKQMDIADTVFNIGRSSLLVAALASGQLQLIRHAMQDRVHQPYRAALIPGMAEILETAVSKGALGAALSGAGPTLIAFVEKDSMQKEQLEQFLKATLAKEGIEADTLWLTPCTSGAEVISVQAADGAAVSFLETIKGEVRI